MKQLGLFIVFLSALIIVSCDKDEDEVSARFDMLTTPVWVSDSLLVNGSDASGSGELLGDFNGDVKFNADGTGYFGDYTGTWRFEKEETELVIITDALDFPLTTKIAELTSSSLKITTDFPNPLNPEEEFNIRMTFKAK
ncbi:MAG: hypothetical protein R6U58_01685 [Bacteroidales bacterium]